LAPAATGDSIQRWLDETTANGLLTEPAESEDERPVAAGELDAPCLAELASRLRDEGKTQAAFLCQQRAAELCPDATYLRHLGELAHIVGKRETARDAYERYLLIEPADAEIRHILTSLRDETPPPRVPNECIKQLYQRFSAFYESNMCEELGYEGPQHLLETIRRSLDGRTDLAVLELGCGTGLAGQMLRPFASRLIGVDLSADMLAKAEARNIYDLLVAAELTEWLHAAEETFDLIVACDTFIYFGDLRQVIGPAHERLNPGGIIAFSVEQAESPPFRLTDSGRYEHHFQHIRDAAETFQMRIASHREAFLRMEYGKEVLGHHVCLA
jgi:predicted TPR repeat methyltransferase